MMMETFEALLDRHGGETANWPAADRDAALVLLTDDAEAQRALRAMRDAEAILFSTRAAAPTVDRLAEIASRQRQARHVPPAARRVGWAAAAMVVLALGVAVGDLRPTHDDGTDTYLAASLDSVGATDVE